jgi:hypothetical protein
MLTTTVAILSNAAVIGGYFFQVNQRALVNRPFVYDISSLRIPVSCVQTADAFVSKRIAIFAPSGGKPPNFDSNSTTQFQSFDHRVLGPRNSSRVDSLSGDFVRMNTGVVQVLPLQQCSISGGGEICQCRILGFNHGEYLLAHGRAGSYMATDVYRGHYYDGGYAAAFSDLNANDSSKRLPNTQVTSPPWDQLLHDSNKLWLADTMYYHSPANLWRGKQSTLRNTHIKLNTGTEPFAFRVVNNKNLGTAYGLKFMLVKEGSTNGLLPLEEIPDRFAREAGVSMSVNQTGDLETAAVFEFKAAPPGSYYAVRITTDESTYDSVKACKYSAIETKYENIVSLQSCAQIKCRGRRVKMFDDDRSDYPDSSDRNSDTRRRRFLRKSS